MKLDLGYYRVDVSSSNIVPSPITLKLWIMYHVCLISHCFVNLAFPFKPQYLTCLPCIVSSLRVFIDFSRKRISQMRVSDVIFHSIVFLLLPRLLILHCTHGGSLSRFFSRRRGKVWKEFIRLFIKLHRGAIDWTCRDELVN